MNQGQLPTPDDIDVTLDTLEHVWSVAKYLVVLFVAGITAGKVVLKIGENKRRYEELVEDVSIISSRLSGYLLVSEYRHETELCKTRQKEMMRDQIRTELVSVKREMADIKDHYEIMNANICRIMGAMDIKPVDEAKRRRAGE